MASYGGGVGFGRVALAHGLGGLDGGFFDHAQEFQREIDFKVKRFDGA